MDTGEITPAPGLRRGAVHRRGLQKMRSCPT